tara:strand:+ start:1657 stop:2703 length:1047 start_codon:yes stop_codon:yes gene_type:complete
MTRVCITGGAGFIAHHAIETILNETDWEIVTIDRIDFSGNYNRLVDLLKNHSGRSRVKTVWHDLKAEFNPQIKSFLGKCDYIVHMAASSHVDRSIEYPLDFVMDNVIGTVNVMNWARNLDGLEKMIYFSTDEVFGPAPKGIKYKEWDRYNSTNPYSASKAGAEELAVAYENTYGLPILITHTMNVFGERQHPEKYIPMCIRRVNNGETITVHSNAEKTEAGSRHYIHAKDVADAMLFLLNTKTDKLNFPFLGSNSPSIDPVKVGHNIKFNIVGPEEIDNLSLAKMIAKCQGKKAITEMVDFHSARPGHDLRYALDGELMASLGWTPKLKLTDRIQQVSDWYLDNKDWL